MASRTLDEFENDWTFVDKDGKVDVEVSLRLVRISFTLISHRNVQVLQELFAKQDILSGEFCFAHFDKFMKMVLS